MRRFLVVLMFGILTACVAESAAGCQPLHVSDTASSRPDPGLHHPTSLIHSYACSPSETSCPGRDSLVSVDPDDPPTDDQAGEENFVTKIWLFLRGFILPDELTLIYELRSWLSRQDPLHPRTRAGDLRRTDEIYHRAVYLAEGDAVLAMLGCAWATLPYHTFPARVPLIDVGITVPVSTERRDAFERRMANIPGMLFSDSPRALDRDKLPHFFGSAWLQLLTGRPGVATFAGEALEWAESIFKLEGSRDARDIAVNHLGVQFARALQQHRDVLPSDILKLELDSHELRNNAQDPAR